MALLLYELVQRIVFWLALRLNRLFSSPKARRFLELRNPATLTPLLAQLASRIPAGTETAWLHVASAGELEQAKPVIRRIHESRGTLFVITYFSPSAEPFLPSGPGILGCFGMPLDIRALHRKILRTLGIRFVMLVRYDLWPGLLEAARLHRCPALLLAASATNAHDSLWTKLFSPIKRRLYSKFSHIFAVTKNDAAHFSALGLPGHVYTAGEPKWARAKERVERIRKANPPVQVQRVAQLLKAQPNRRVVIFGSPHREELETLFQLLQKPPRPFVICVPHEIHEDALSSIETQLQTVGATSLRLSRLAAEDPAGLDCLIIDAIGFLAELYGLADLAVVGGGFDGQIHNTLEAAAHGVPVLYGARLSRAVEAQQLVNAGAALSFATPHEMYYFLRRFVEDSHDRGTNPGDSLDSQLTAMRSAATRLFDEVPETSEFVLRALSTVEWDNPARLVGVSKNISRI